MLITRRNLMGGKPLPYDAEVEYLESNSNGYRQSAWCSVDTGWHYRGSIENVTISYDFEFVKNIKQVPFGVQKDGYGNQIYPYYSSGVTDTRVFYFDGLQGFNQKTIPVGERITGSLSFGGGHLVINTNGTEDSFAYSGVVDETSSLHLFSGIEGTTLDDGAAIRLYDFSISENGVMVFDYVPVIKDNIPCVFDRVSGNLFYNVGNIFNELKAGPIKTT